MDPSVCCETRLYAAAMMLEGLANHLRELRVAGRLDREVIHDAFAAIQVVNAEILDAVNCAADELSIMHAAARARLAVAQ